MAAKTLDVAEFEAILRDGKSYMLIDFFKGTSEVERAVLAPTAVSWFKKNPSFQQWDDTNGERRHRAILNALLVTTSADQLEKQRYVFAWPHQFEFELLTALRPSALRNFGEVLIQQNVNYYATVHELLTLGLCDVPASDAFVLGLIGSARFRIPLSERIKSQPWILEKIWRLFELEGDGENSLAAQDKFLPEAHSWAANLTQLAASGELDRARLLDESLNALDRGFAQFRAGWFSRFHESMKPTIEERRERAELYGRLVGSAIAPTVAFALSALTEIDKHSALSAEFLGRVLPPAFTAKSKSTVTSAISLIAKAVKRDPSFAPTAFTLVLPALAHESPDVQAKALDFLEKSGGLANVELRAQLAEYIDLVSPSVRSRLGTLTGESVSLPACDEVVKTYQQNAAKPASPLERSERISPITEIDDIDAMAFCLEHPDAAVEIERVIDGVSRLYASNREQIATKMKPVLKRAAKLYDTNAAQAWFIDVRNLLAEFILNLDARKTAMKLFVGNADSERLASEEYSLHYQQALPKLTAAVLLLHGRFDSVLATVATGQSLPDFATPTHTAGWIDPVEMAQRIELWKASSARPTAYAQAVALCRLPLAHSELLTYGSFS